jgi:hypothetical protein
MANELGLKKAISDYFEGKSLIKLKIDSAAHCIRAKNQQLYVNGKNIVPDVYDVKERYNPFR